MAAAQGSTHGEVRSGLHRTAIAFGNVLFGTRNYVFPVVLLGVALGTRPVLAGASPRTDLWLDALGVLVAVAGQALRALVIGLQYIRRGGREGRIYAGALVDGGIFAHVRNPLYVGNLLVVAGLALIHNGPWFYGVGLPFFVAAYVSITLAEEEYLVARFGTQYQAYRARVPRFVPRLRGLGATVRGARFDWRKVLVKEYGSTFAWATTALGLVAWERYTQGGAAPLIRVAPVLLAVWSVVLVGWATIRVLKKSRRLVPALP